MNLIRCLKAIFKRIDNPNALSTIMAMALILSFILSIYTPDILLSKTYTIGGDTISHFYPTKYLHDELIPRGRFVGWMPGWFAGMPVSQFYFPLTFIFMAVLGYFIPLEIAFKIVTALFVIILPFCSYLLLRFLGYKYPTPTLAAIFTLPFLFMENQTMWGLNIPSTLAGLFSHGISFALGVIFLGSVYRGLKEEKWIFQNIILISAIVLTHVYSTLLVVPTSFVLMFLDGGKKWKKYFEYLLKVYVPSFLLTCFWTIPMVLNSEYTSAYNYNYVIVEKLVPFFILPFVILAFISSIKELPKFSGIIFFISSTFMVFFIIDGLYLDFQTRADNSLIIGKIANILWGDPFTGFNFLVILLFPLALILSLKLKDLRMRYLSTLMFIPLIFFSLDKLIGIIFIRFVPVNYFLLFIFSAILIGKVIEQHSNSWIIVLVISVMTIWWVNDARGLTEDDAYYRLTDGEYEGYIPNWVAYNYGGYPEDQSKKFFEITDFLKGDFRDSRVVYEHNILNSAFGGIRVFESLPLFSGRSTLEGLYLQSSITTPFVFYIQSEIGVQTSCPFAPKYNCTRLNLERAKKHLKMFNVGEYIAVTPEANEQAMESEDYVLEKKIGNYSIYSIKDSGEGYVSVWKNYPLKYSGKDWKAKSYIWFQNLAVLDTPIIFNAKDGELPEYKTIKDLNEITLNPIEMECKIEEKLEFEEISFSTDCPGIPHIISMSYHPRWKVVGAEKIYLVTPSFMMVVPTSENVTLTFSNDKTNYLGIFLSILGFLLTIILHRNGWSHPLLKRYLS